MDGGSLSDESMNPPDVGDGASQAYDRTPQSWGITTPWNLPVPPNTGWWPPPHTTKSP
jgi:hypothetical protein